MKTLELKDLKDLSLSEICICNWKEKWPFLLELKNPELTLSQVLCRYHSYLSIPSKTPSNMEGCIKYEQMLSELGAYLKDSFKHYINIVVSDSKISFKGHNYPSISVTYKRCEEHELITSFQVAVVRKYLTTLESAQRRGLAFNLTLSDVKRLMSRKTCFYTKKKFVNKNEHPDSPTIDRIDCNKGYVKGNVVVCTKYSNELKSNLFEHRDVDILLIKRIVDTLTALNVKT